MRCPFCADPDTKVVDSRVVEEGDSVRRRRECLKCGERFTTYETAELALPVVVKRDGRREEFDVAKLRVSLMKALEKRPVAVETVENALNRIKRWARTRGEREIGSVDLGEQVMEELRRMDEVAYVRFASVYRSFQDVNAFREEIERLEKKLAPKR